MLSSTASRTSDRWWIPLLVVGYFLYFTSDGLRAYFSHDDLMNLYVAWSAPLNHVLQAALLLPSTVDRPLGGLFYVVTYNLAGFNPVAFRVVVFALLIANIWLTYETARRLTGSRETGAAAALLAAVHARFGALYYDTGVVYDVLCYTFYFATFLYYLRIRGQGVIPGTRQMITLAVLFACTIDSKEMAVTMPLSLLAYELVYHWPTLRSAGEIWRWSWREGRAVWLTGLMTLWFIGGKIFGPSSLLHLAPYMPVFTWERFVSNWGAFLDGLFHRTHWFTPRSTVAVWLIALAAAWLVKSKAARLAWLFVMFSGLPVLFILQRDTYAYYIPLFGWALLAASVLGAAAKSLTRSLPGSLAMLLAMALVPWNRTLELPPFRDPAKADCDIASLARQLHSLHPRFNQESRLLFRDDPFPAFMGYQVMYLVRLSYRDNSLVVHRSKVTEPYNSDVGQPHDHVFDWRDGRLIELPASGNGAAAGGQ